MWFTSSNARAIQSKVEQREKGLALASAYVASDHDVYLGLTAQEIVAGIEKGQWTASQVVQAYITRAALSAKLTNSVTEVLFEQARLQAKQLDDEFAATKKLRGPLHGVPVSFKDQYTMEGVDACIGYSQWVNKPGPQDADLVVQFRTAGAIPIVKTNVPQTMLSFECNNPVWGRTTNPWNDKYTSGGSSGGEAALLAMDGSVIGLGSDVGGSLRIPTSYCGVYSLKPTVGRMSTTGAKSANPGFELVKSVVGPMARSVGDVELACKISFGQQGVNRESVPLPFRDVELPAKLKFGYYTSDCVVKASPACKRAVLETVEALRKQGHECVELDVGSYAARAFSVFCALSSADGYKTLLSHLGPDPKDKSLFLVTLGPSLPWFLRRFGAWVVETFLHDPLFAKFFRLLRVKSFHEVMQFVVQRNELTGEWQKEIWEKNGLDSIIAPVQAVPTLPHGASDKLSAIACATIFYNVIDSPVGCVPVTRVDPAKDQLTEEWFNGPGHGSSLLEDGLYKGKKPVYDPAEMKGVPVGIQVVGRKWEDEKVLSMMHVVDRALGPRGFGPLCWSEGNGKAVVT